MDTVAQKHVCLIGGGVSGLATAHLLAKSGACDIVLAEKGSRLRRSAYTMELDLQAVDTFTTEPRWADMGVNDFNASTYTRLVAAVDELGIKEATATAARPTTRSPNAYPSDDPIRES